MSTCTEEKKADRIIVRLTDQCAEMAPHFLRYRQNEIRQLNAAVRTGNLEQVRITGHDMKGIGGTYNVAYITEIGMALEKAALHGDWLQIKHCIVQLEDNLQKIQIVCDEPE